MELAKKHDSVEVVYRRTSMVLAVPPMRRL